MSVARKQDAMHEMFGAIAERCADCCHLICEQGHRRNYYKCEIYGVSNSEATDWGKYWQACGAFNLVHLPMVNIYKSLAHVREPEKPLDGQIELDL